MLCARVSLSASCTGKGALSLASVSSPCRKNAIRNAGIPYVYRQLMSVDKSIGDLCSELKLRRAGLERLEARAAKGVMADALETLLAQTVGAVRFTLLPYDRDAKQLYNALYQRELRRKLEQAYWWYFACGVSGVALTPIGIRPIDPKTFNWFGELDEPEFTLREVYIHRQNLPLLKSPLVEQHGLPERSYDSQPDGHAEYLTLYEVYHHDRKRWYYYDESYRLLFEREAGWYEGHLLLVSRYRPRLVRSGASFYRMPISLVEHTRRHADYYDDLYEATVRDAIQGTILQVYTPGVEEDSRERLKNNFKIVQLRQPQPATFPLKTIDLGTISAVRQQVNYELGMSTGAIGYARGAPMDVRYATEAAMVGQYAQARYNRAQDYHLHFAEQVLESARGYYAQLPLSRHRIWLRTERYHFGVTDTYGDALAGRTVSVISQAQDYIAQRQQTLVVLAIAEKIAPIASPLGIDIQKLLRELIRRILYTHDLDPDEYLAPDHPLNVDALLPLLRAIAGVDGEMMSIES